VVPVLTLAVAYTVAAWLALWLTISLGYATAIWPAAGLALAGVLIGGDRVSPGIWLGSFAVNLWLTWDALHATALPTGVVISASIGVGATVQALIGASLVRRWVGFPSPLTRARDIGTFLLLGGPLSCLVSATVGVTTLALSGQLSWPLFVTTWLTWWGGDTLGVLIATPVVLSWLAEPRAIWRLRRFSVGLPLVGLLVLGFIVFGYARAQERARLRLHFERQAERWAHAIGMRLDDYVEVLHACESFYASAPAVSQQAFRTFVRRSFARHPSLQALSLHLRMPDTRREAYEQAVRGEGLAAFQSMQHTTPGGLVWTERRPEDIAVTYIETRAGSEAALGFDAAFVHDRLEALQQARDTGRPTATGRLTLGQDPGHQFGLLIFLPLYNPVLPHALLEERRQNLHGYVTGVFQIGAMVETALPGLEPRGMVLWIEDEAAPADRRMLYDSRARAPEDLGLGLDAVLGTSATRMHWQTTVEVAGRRWGLHFAPTFAYVAARQGWQPWAVMGSGLAFSGLLGVFLLISTGRATRIEQLMVERTAQFDVSKQMETEARQRRHEAEVLAELARTVNADLEVDTVLQRVVNGAQELCDSDGAAIALREPGVEAAVQSLAEVVHVLSPSLDATEVSQRVVDHVNRLLKTRAAILYQLEPTSEMLIALAMANDFSPPDTPWRTLPFGMGAAGLAVCTRQLVVTADILSDPRLTIPAAVRAGIARTPVRSVLALPLLHDGQVIGALSIGAELGRTFDAEALALGRLFAYYATTALANAQLYAEVQASQIRQQDLSRQLLEVQEAERRRIAHELHDEAGQLLAAVHLALEATIIGLPPQFREGFDQVRSHLDAIETQLRGLAHELRPTILDDLGLLPALQGLAQRVAERTGLCIRVDYACAGRLAPAVETALYRIMQEGLTNISKHAAATHVELQLWQNDKRVHGLLRDDGVGFAVEHVLGPTGLRGLGLLGIQERLQALGGTLEITSAPGQGTTLQITLPETVPDPVAGGALPLGFWQSAGAQ
jgi:signal transduction histidine kinase/CHASE1-domain containing sensor protein